MLGETPMHVNQLSDLLLQPCNRFRLQKGAHTGSQAPWGTDSWVSLCCGRRLTQLPIQCCIIPVMVM